jgi:hypothetical protein
MLENEDPGFADVGLANGDLGHLEASRRPTDGR